MGQRTVYDCDICKKENIKIVDHVSFEHLGARIDMELPVEEFTLFVEKRRAYLCRKCISDVFMKAVKQLRKEENNENIRRDPGNG